MFRKMLLALLMVISVASTLFAAGKPVVIDVRTEMEWNAGHVDGAILIPYDKIGDQIHKAVPDKKTRIILYCRTGRRSGIATETMKKAGYNDIVDLKTLENAAKELKRPIVR